MSDKEKLFALAKKEEDFGDDDEREEFVNDLLKSKDQEQSIKVLKGYGLDLLSDAVKKILFMKKKEQPMLVQQSLLVEASPVDEKELQRIREQTQRKEIISIRKKLDFLKELPDSDIYKTIYWCLLGCKVYESDKNQLFQDLMGDFKISKEDLTNKFYQLENTIKKSTTPLNKSNLINQMIERLDTIKTKQISFDVVELLQLIEEGEEASKDVQSLIDAQKKFTVLIGKTGAGKTTFILGCCGHKMVQKQYTNGLSWVTTQQQLVDQKLKQLVSYPGSKSVTRNVLAIPVPSETSVVILDTPGFSDTNGVEQDAANCKVMINSLSKFSKVSIAVMVNGKNQGGRCEGVKELCSWLSKLFPAYINVQKSLKFIFNRYSQKDLRQIHKQCQEVIKQIQTLPNRNQNFIDVLENLKQKTQQREKIFSYHPLNQDSSKQITDFIKETKKNKVQLAFPSKHFELAFSPQTRSAIKDQAHILEKIVMRYFNSKEYNYSRWYFRLFELMTEQTNECKDQLENLKRSLTQTIKKIGNESINQLLLRVNNLSISSNDVIRFKDSIKTLDQISKEYSKYLEESLFKDLKLCMLQNVVTALKGIITQIQKGQNMSYVELKPKVAAFKLLSQTSENPEQQLRKLEKIIRTKLELKKTSWLNLIKTDGFNQSVEIYTLYKQFNYILEDLIQKPQATTFFEDEIAKLVHQKTQKFKVLFNQINVKIIEDITKSDNSFNKMSQCQDFMVMIDKKKQAQILQSVTAAKSGFQTLALQVAKKIKQRIKNFDRLNCRQSQINILSIELEKMIALTKIPYLKNQLQIETSNIKAELKSYVENQQRRLQQSTEILKKETCTSSHIKDMLKRLRISIQVMDNVSLFYGDCIEDKNNLIFQAEECLKEYFERVIAKLRTFDINFNKSEEQLREDIEWLDDAVDVGNIYDQNSDYTETSNLIATNTTISNLTASNQVKSEKNVQKELLTATNAKKIEESSLILQQLQEQRWQEINQKKRQEQIDQKKNYLQMKEPCKSIKSRIDSIFSNCIANFTECLNQFKQSKKQQYLSISMKKINKYMNIIENMKNRLKIPRNKEFQKLYIAFLNEIKQMRNIVIIKTQNDLNLLSNPTTDHNYQLYFNIRSKIAILYDIEKQHKQIGKQIGDTEFVIAIFKKKIEQIYQKMADSISQLEDKAIKGSQLKKLKNQCEMSALFDLFLKDVKSSVCFASLADQLKEKNKTYNSQSKALIKNYIESKNYFKINKALQGLQGNNFDFYEEQLVVKIQKLLELVQHNKKQAQFNGIIEGQLLISLEQLAKIRNNMTQVTFVNNNSKTLKKIDDSIDELGQAILKSLEVKKQQILQDLEMFKMNKVKLNINQFIQKQVTLSQSLQKVRQSTNTSSPSKKDLGKSVKDQFDKNMTQLKQMGNDSGQLKFNVNFYRIYKNFLNQQTKYPDLQKLQENILTKLNNQIQKQRQKYYQIIYHDQNIFTSVRKWGLHLPEAKKQKFLSDLESMREKKILKTIQDFNLAQKNIPEIKKSNTVELIKYRKDMLSNSLHNLPENNKQIVFIEAIKQSITKKLSSPDFLVNPQTFCNQLIEIRKQISEKDGELIKIFDNFVKTIISDLKNKQRVVKTAIEGVNSNNLSQNKSIIVKQITWFDVSHSKFKTAPKEETNSSIMQQLIGQIDYLLHTMLKQFSSKYSNAIKQINCETLFTKYQNEANIKNKIIMIKNFQKIKQDLPKRPFNKQLNQSQQTAKKLFKVFESKFKKLVHFNLKNQLFCKLQDDYNNIKQFFVNLQLSIQGIKVYLKFYNEIIIPENQEKIPNSLLQFEQHLKKCLLEYKHQIQQKASKLSTLQQNELQKLKKYLKLVKCFDNVFPQFSQNTIIQFNKQMTKSINDYARQIKYNVQLLNKKDKQTKNVMIVRSSVLNDEYSNYRQKHRLEYQKKVCQKTTANQIKIKGTVKNQNQSDEEYSTRIKIINQEFSAQIQVLKNQLDETLLSKEKQNKDQIKIEEQRILSQYSKIVESIVKNLIEIKAIEMNLESVESMNNDSYKNAMNSIGKLRTKNMKAIVVALENSKDSKVGKFILANQQCFRSLFIEKIMKKTDAVTIDIVLEKLKVSQGVIKENLKIMYHEYLVIYEQNLADYRRNPYPVSINQLVDKIKQQAEGYKINRLDGNKLLAHILSLYSIIKSKKDEENTVQIPFKPHPAQVISMFLELDLGQDKMKNKFCQVKTGEGKSLILAGVAAFLSLIDFNVRCVCYSKFLSKRDHDNFQELFSILKVDQKIRYLDFFQLMEEICNSPQFKIRQVITHILLDDKKYENIKIPLLEEKSNTVLLIDEVDTFFNTDFYGESYPVYTPIKNKLIGQLLSYVWINRKKITLKSLKQSQQYLDVVNLMKPIQPFLYQAIKSMITVINNPNTDLVYVIKDDKIAYKQQDSIISNVNYGYQTIFSYFEEYEKKNIRTLPQTISEIAINICQISYAEVIKSFRYIIGVSGTLNNLSQTQLQILQKQYKINSIYQIPSVYGQNKLKINPISILEDHLFYTGIVDQTKQAIKEKRPVLIFCQSIQEANGLFLSEEFKDLKGKTVILSEKNDDDIRKQRIERASIEGSITILTRVFGRGTDFVLYDESISGKGGILVIQTFLSDDDSQDIQLKGRAARQGDQGSHSLIIRKTQLLKLKIDPDTMQPKTSDEKRKTIQDSRKNQNDIKWKKIETDVAQLKQKHLATKKLFEYIIKGNNAKIREELLKLNIIADPPEKMGPVRTLIGIDATQSMEQSLKQLSQILPHAFERIYQIVNIQNLADDRFEIQIAFYRNYDSDQEDFLFNSSQFQSSHEKLIEFLNNVSPYGGWGNEALELFYQHANSVEKLTQIIIIADAGSNTKWQTDKKREKNYQLWKNSDKYKKACYSDDQLPKLLEKKIEIHSLAIGESLSYFQKISKASNGETLEFFPQGDNAEQMLTNFISRKILEKMGRNEKDRIKLVELYKKKFGG